MDEGKINEAKMAVFRYQSYLEHYIALNSGLCKLYEKEIYNVQTTHSEHPMSMSQKQQIFNEIKEMEHLCSFGLRRDGDIGGVIHERIFHGLLHEVEEKCH